MYLRITIRFLDGRYHGRTDGGASEWPPSPWRLFQALLAGAKSDWTGDCAAAFGWLEAQDPPVIHLADVDAPDRSAGVLTYVPGNTADHGRMPKLVQPRVLPDHARHVGYLWAIGPDDQAHASTMSTVARHIRCVGWGIDLAIGHGEVLADLPEPGEGRIALSPSPSGDFGGDLLRAPRVGSLASLEQAHDVAMNRLRYNALTKTVEVHDQPGLPIFQRRTYGPVGGGRPFCAFDLCRPDDPESDEHASFDPRQIKAVVGMVRGLLGSSRVRAAWDDEFVNNRMLGHPREYAGPRVSILPLLSVGHRHADGRVRRLILTEPVGADGAVCHRLAELLNGQMLVPDAPGEKPAARLVRLSDDDTYVRHYYARAAPSWATVSPVLLPGFDGRTDRRSTGDRQLAPSKQRDRAVQLVRKSLEHAGVTADPDIELSPVSWWAGVPHAAGFVPREKLGPCPRYHVKLTFSQPYAGPLSLGRQRHAGLGVFAAIDAKG